LELNTNPWLYGGGTPFGTYTAVQSMSWTAGRTRVWIREDGQVQPPAGGTEIVMQPDANGEDMVALVRTSDRGATLWAGRVAVPVMEMFFGYCVPRPYCTEEETQPEPGRRLYVEKYHVAQSHTVTATEYPEPLQIDAPAIVAPGQPVTLTVRGAGGLRLRYPRLDTADVGWMWFPGDTAAVPNPGWPEGPYECSTPVCTFTPREGGRMLVWTWVEGAYVEAWSDVIRVGNVDTCDSGPAEMMALGSLGSDSECTPPVPLSLSCTGNQQQSGTVVVVRRGAETRCEVTSSPAPQDVEWSFTASTGHVVRGPVGPTFWEGRMVIDGTVHVSATVAGAPDSASKTISIRRRDWSTLRLAVSEQPTNDLPPPAAVTLSKHLGDSHLSEELPGAPTQVSGGPNDGWWYLEHELPPLEYTVHINHAALAPGSAWYNLQHWQPFWIASLHQWGAYCGPSDLSGVLRMVRRHEGLDAAAPGLTNHVDAIKSYFRNDAPDDSLERVVVVPDSNASGARDVFAAGYRVWVWGGAVDYSQHQPEGQTSPPGYYCALRPWN
jgi:hypothetical protein